MSKKRKTRHQKILADKRHVLYHHEIPDAKEIKLDKENIEITPISYSSAKKTESISSFAYVSEDMKKIFLISSVVMVSQIVLLFILGRI